MKHFLIATNSLKDEDLRLTGEIEQYIIHHGGSATRIIGDRGGSVGYYLDQKEPFDCILALGGDGTILKAI